MEELLVYGKDFGEFSPEGRHCLFDFGARGVPLFPRRNGVGKEAFKNPFQHLRRCLGNSSRRGSGSRAQGTAAFPEVMPLRRRSQCRQRISTGCALRRVSVLRFETLRCVSLRPPCWHSPGNLGKSHLMRRDLGKARCAGENTAAFVLRETPLFPRISCLLWLHGFHAATGSRNLPDAVRSCQIFAALRRYSDGFLSRARLGGKAAGPRACPRNR